MPSFAELHFARLLRSIGGVDFERQLLGKFGLLGFVGTRHRFGVLLDHVGNWLVEATAGHVDPLRCAPSRSGKVSRTLGHIAEYLH